MSKVSPLIVALIRDSIWVLVLVILWICFNFNFWVDGNIRGWFRGDIRISLPYTGAGTIPTVPLVMYAFVLPVVVLVLTWIFFDKIFCPNTWKYNDIEETNEDELFHSVPSRHTLSSPIATTTLATQLHFSQYHSRRQIVQSMQQKSTHWPHYHDNTTKPFSRKIRFAIYQFYIYVICILFCIFITTSLKLITGRLRPDFLDRCQPNYNDPKLKIGPNGWIDPEYSFICTNDDKNHVSGGRESFPSGHASSSMTSAVFISILLYKRGWNRALRSGFGFIWIPFLIMAVLSGAMVIAFSRFWDNRHFFSDILGGLLIGVLCGSISLLFPYAFTPTYELDGTLLSNETRQINNRQINNRQINLRRQNDQNEMEPLNEINPLGDPSSSTPRAQQHFTRPAFNVESNAVPEL